MGVAERSQSSITDVQNWISTFGWDFPTGIDDEGRPIYVSFSVIRDTFVVLDQNGVAQLVSGYNTNSTFITFPLIHQKVDELLLTPVEPSTWGRIKMLFYP